MKTLTVSLLALALAQPAGRAAAREPAPPAANVPTPPSFAPLAERVKPVVVAIQSTQRARAGTDDRDPLELFHHFFGAPGAEERRQHRHSLGSGFIISEQGLVITNYHVVKGASDVAVKLDDGREFKADVIGRDSKTDVALVRLRGGPKGLPVARLGDSDQLHVGDWVVAIGNPFGLGHTVTSGIVSAKERFFGAGPYDDFIQTDASINPGNSGGPLFDSTGSVVGVSAAIIQGGQGIGFAIPINIVKNVVKQLEARGQVVRGWIGIDIQELTPTLASAFKLDRNVGALVASVDPHGPAARAGLQPGDVIVEWNGRSVRESIRLPLLVAETAPNERAKMTVVRQGERRVLAVEVGTLREREEREDVAGREEPSPAADRRQGGKLGARVEELTPEVAHRLGLSAQRGALVVAVYPGGPAEGVLEVGDVVVEADQRPVRATGTLEHVMAEHRSGDVLLLRINRGQQLVYGAIKLR
jgi:serine protease Do